MTEEQRREFERVTRPVIEWLNANCNPHTTAVVSTSTAEIHEITLVYLTNDYLRD